MAPIIRSRSVSSRLTRRAALSPSRSSWCMRPRDAAVMAVSAAEIRAEIARMKIRVGASASRAATSAGSFADEEGVDLGRIDVLRHKGLAKRAGEDEGQPAALGLLVLAHVGDQAGGVERVSGDLEQPHRQAGGGNRAGGAGGVLP